MISPAGTFEDVKGYPRGNQLRADPAFTDVNLVWKILDNDPSHAMCFTGKQDTPNQTQGSPALKASPGDMVAMRYQENGHVTIFNPEIPKPPNSGTVYIYGTTQPRADDKLYDIHPNWTLDGKGGDGRGFLLATRNYDDGQCYEVNETPKSQQRQKEFAHEADPEMGQKLWCQTDVTIPDTLPAEGALTIYWVWDWPTLNADGSTKVVEIYTSCIDIELVPGQGTSKSLKYDDGQILNKAAIKSQLTNQFDVEYKPKNGSPVPAGSNRPKVPAIIAVPLPKDGASAAPADPAPAPSSEVSLSPAPITTTQPKPITDNPKKNRPSLSPAPPAAAVPEPVTVTVTDSALKEKETVYVTVKESSIIDAIPTPAVAPGAADAVPEEQAGAKFTPTYDAYTNIPSQTAAVVPDTDVAPLGEGVVPTSTIVPLATAPATPASDNRGRPLVQPFVTFSRSMDEVRVPVPTTFATSASKVAVPIVVVTAVETDVATATAVVTVTAPRGGAYTSMPEPVPRFRRSAGQW